MPEQQKPARRHHVVSKFYLRRFANPRNQLIRCPLDGKAHLQSVNDATVRKDFYSVLAEGVEQDAFETELAEVETEAAAAFTAILRNGVWPPTLEHRLAVSAWIGLQHLRGEHNRRMVEQMHRILTKLEVGMATVEQIRELVNAPSDAPDDEVEAARAYILSTADSLPIHHHAHLMAIGQVLERAIMSVFDRQPWTLVEFSWDALGTSDTPVVVVPDEDALAGLRAVGIGSAPALYVPLSTRAGLFMDELGATAPDGRMSGSPELARSLNEFTLRTTRRALYYHPDTDPFAGFEMQPPREQEVMVSHDQLSNFIDEAALEQGRPSWLQASTE
ncbi:DUF4238 domain-containing protein [Glycomyces tritici]|uniref:DUF4238 domain-containing protein n=1 Tax=Glycomyces tritici TaxID=2665176 RepID=A0ABT7YVB5_9ACTN|nr:DUF4238 domain-containing protein [Glycomyces tritici]MDN3242576.1 DUF4238 domain-containing protein [Glycomyces tritici]